MSDEIHHVGENDPGYPYYISYTQLPPKISMSAIDKTLQEIYNKKVAYVVESSNYLLYGYYRHWSKRINWNRLIAPRYTHYEIKFLMFYKEWKYRIKNAVDALKGKEYE
jgi:hypothetical protein